MSILSNNNQLQLCGFLKHVSLSDSFDSHFYYCSFCPQTFSTEIHLEMNVRSQEHDSTVKTMEHRCPFGLTLDELREHSPVSYLFPDTGLIGVFG